MKAVAAAVAVAVLAAGAQGAPTSTCSSPGKKIVGTRGNDILKGTPRADTICGLSGNDQLVALGGNDRVLGGPGDDRIAAGPGDDHIEGGPGTDLLGYRRSAGAVRVDLARGASSGSDGSDHIRSVEDIAGSAYEDVLIGDRFANRLAGRNGDDDMRGGLGNDVLDAGDGNDLVAGGAGNDEILGGAGTDVFDFRGLRSPLVLTLGADDKVTVEGTDLYSRVEVFSVHRSRIV